MKKQLSEPIVEQIVELTYNNFKSQRQEERLDTQKLKQFKQHYIKPLYPYVLEQQQHDSKRRYKCCQACGQSAGGFCCCSSSVPENSFVKFGLAICLYFKFLKHANYYFIFMTLLSLTACVVCYYVSMQNGFSTTSDYSTFFFSLGYGTFSSQHFKCSYALINNTQQATISVSCPYGLVNASVIKKSIPSVFTYQSKNTLYNCRNQRKAVENGTYLINSYLSILSQKNVTMSSDGKSASATLTFNGSQPNSLISYSYECYNNVYSIGKITTSSDNFFLYVVLVDLVFTFFFIVFLCSQTSAEEDEVKFFNKEQVALDNFTVMIKGINRNEVDKQLNALMGYFQQHVSPRFKQSLVSITIPQVSTEIDQQEQRRQVYQDFYYLINKYYFRSIEEPIQFKDCHVIVNNLMSKEQIAEMKMQFRKCTEKLLKLRRRQAIKESDESISIYLVFDKVLAKDTVMSCMTKFCCSKKLVVTVDRTQKQFELETPPVPDSIIWQNRTKWSRFRTFFMWIITVIICFGSYVLFGYIQYKQTQLLSTYNYNIDCTVLFPNTNFSVYNATLAASANYQTCYCDGKSLLDVASNQNTDCSTWQKQYIVYKSIPLLISLGIVMFNIIVSYLFIYLTRFQKHQYVHSYELSYAFKRAFMLILNMGLILILLNLNYNNNTYLQQVNFLFLGKYNDFTPDWYNNIGAIITLTLIFNISFPIVELLMACIFKCFKKCWDTRCCNLPTSRQTKKEYIQYYNDEVYPIGQRYAYLMATFFVSMSFCGIIPLLVPVTVVCLFLLYNADKILIFRHYQTPQNYTQTLHKAFIIVLYLSIISHCALTAYFLSEPNLIATSSYIPGTGSSVSSGSARLDNMIKTGYILPYLGLLALLVLFAIFKEFLLGFFGWLFGLCCIKQERNDKSAVVQRSKLYDILSDIQRQTLKMAMERELQNIEIKKKENSRLDIGDEDDLNQTQRAYVNALIIQEEVFKNSLRQINKRKDGQVRMALLGIPSYQAHSKLQQILKEYQMLRFEKKLKELVSSDMIKSLADKFAQGPGNETQEQLYFHINI